LDLIADDVAAEIAVGTGLVPIAANSLLQIEDDCNRKAMILARESYQRLPRFGLNIGRVDHGQAAGGKPFAGNELKHLESIFGGRLVVLVVADQPAAEIGRQHLGRFEMTASKGRFARP
jgi:hypothetical protein